jgi:nicotinate-nucleotide--dimethylbenzimidazole phosphoribosyltransferase
LEESRWLGDLTDIAVQSAAIFQTTKPELQDPALLVFAADHGFLDVQEVDAGAFLSSNSVVHRAARSAGLKLHLIDSGLRAPMDNMVDYWIFRESGFLPRKIKPATRNVIHEAAMTTSECHAAIAAGVSVVEQRYYAGSNAVALTGTGTGALHAARMLIAVLRNEPLVRMLPTHLKRIPLNKNLQRAINRHPMTHDPITNLTLFGGFETAMLTGAVLQAAHRQMFVLLDGLPAFAALEAARALHPEVEHYVCMAQRLSDEPAFERNPIPAVQETPLLDGRGLGAALAMPAINSVLHCL